MPTGLWLLFALLILAFARTVLAVVGCRLHVHTARHDLIRETKTKRIAYLRELAMRQYESIEVDEPEPEVAVDRYESAEPAPTEAEAPPPIASLAPEAEADLKQAA